MIIMEEERANFQAVSEQPQLSSADNSTKERFIVFLDIMGFKDRVARNSHDNVLKQLEAFQTTISTYVAQFKNNNIQLALFSDSILVFSNDNSLESLNAIATVSSKIMMSALQQKTPIPLKGAIAYGTVTCNLSKQLFFGQALIDAYLLEENVKYYGILVHHTAEALVRQLNSSLFRDVKACLKSGEISHYELNWYRTQLDSEKSQLPLSECLNNLRLTVCDEPRKYVDNTIKIAAS